MQDKETKQDKEKTKITYVRDVRLDLPESTDDSWAASFRVPEIVSSGADTRKRCLSPRFLFPAGLMLLALLTGAAIYTLSTRSADAKQESSLPASADVSTHSSSSDMSMQSAPGYSLSDLSENNAGTAQESESTDNEVPSEKEEDTLAFLLPPEGYDYEKPVPEKNAQAENWFDDAVFVGNSRTQGLLLYTGISAQAVADVGLTVETVSTTAAFDDPDDPEGKITAVELLEKSDYHKVYLMFGINELGWQHEEIFISRYTALIETIRESHPNVQIYVQSILPVYEDKITDRSYLTNVRIVEFNEKLQAMAAEQQVYYLDVYSALADENGQLPEDLSSDGIHLRQEGCVLWKDYLLAHCVTSEPGSGQSSAEGGTEKSYAPIHLPELSSENDD